MSFPQRTSFNHKGTIGETYFKFFIENELDCIYHPIQQENDFGIDGIIEIVLHHNVTGKQIAVQIKHGDSYFKHSTKYGYRFISDMKHLNYYTNYSLPVFIIILSNDFQNNHWVRFDINNTMAYDENKWWIEIPIENQLSTNFKQEILKLVEINNYEEKVKESWIVDELLNNIDKTYISISKKNVEKKDFSEIQNFISKCSKNKDLLLKSYSCLDIFFDEYSSRKEEITEIPEIMEWFKLSIEKKIPWFYFLNLSQRNNTFNLLLHAYCKHTFVKKHNKQIIYNYDNDDISQFLELNFINLNIFLENHNIEKEMSQKITKDIINYLNLFLF